MAKTDFYDIVNDKEAITRQMVFFSTFILVFENFVSTWKQAIFHLYLYCYYQIKENENKDKGERTFVCNERFKYLDITSFQNLTKQNPIIQSAFDKEVWKPNNVSFNNQKLSSERSMFYWMKKNLFIEENDMCVLLQAHKRRCDFAHEIDINLRKKINTEDLNLLKKLISISQKASANWVLKVTLPSNKTNSKVDFFDDKGNKVEPNKDNILTGTSIFYSLVLSNINDIIDNGTTYNA